MGCNCKKNPNVKYVDKEDISVTEIKKINAFAKMGNCIVQLIFGLLASSIVIIAIIPMLLYLSFCLCTGKEMMVRIPNLTKWRK